jgi:tRNA(fMet)-specific endonuclease VapC
LLDTNALSEPARPRPNQALVERLEVHRAEIATAATVWHELIFGLEKLPPSRKRTAIGSYLDDLRSSVMPVLAYDEEAAEWHARERARLELAGRPVSFRDSQIAAVAVVHGLTLVTANVSHFEPLADLEIENWMA